ncbi:MAG: hypothetical protein FJX35_28340, partial [Alphaproteobacteria bacterium]|nr:hypothetical protein [Alphaproteobacteria bacterium]
RIDRAVSMNAIYNPRLRQRHAPGFNWYYLHVAALNVSWIVQAIHAKGYVIGDLKTDNLLVDPGTMVTIIDTDSFQVPDPAGTAVHRCPVGSEGFTPPELIGRDFAEVDRTEVHDRFGLAVIVHLLLTGYHPFNGEWQGPGEPPVRDELIRRGHWPYAETSKLKPGPAAIAPDSFHPAIEDCFRRAFDIGHVKPRGRPTAREWYLALRSAADDLVPCDANPSHLHAGRSSTCVWCARAAEVGIDVFPAQPGAAEQPIVLVKRFERALSRGAERHALDLWARHPELAQLPYTAHHAKQVKRLVRMLSAYDRFLAVLRRDPTNDDLLWRLWQGPPDLAECRSAQSELIGERTVADIASEIGRRAAAVTALRESVRRSGNPPDAAGERAILAVHDADPELFKARLVRLQSLLARVDLARQRVERWDALKLALDAGDDHAIAAAWGADGLLNDFVEAASHRTRIERALPRAKALDAFLAHWQKAPEDDDALWELWSREPDLGESAAARRPCAAMDGQIPFERARLAGRRVDDRLRLRAAATRLPVDPRAVAAAWEAAAWDAPRCQDHGEIKSLWPTIERALVAAARLTDLQALVDSHDAAAIAAAWNDAEWEGYALPDDMASRLREAIAEVGWHGADIAPLLAADRDGAPVADAFAGGEGEDLVLRWDWPADGPPACVVALRNDRFPAAQDDVVHRRHVKVIDRQVFAADGSIRLGALGPDIFAVVWPARLIGGTAVIIRGARPLRLARVPRAALSYAVRRLWLRRAATRLKLTSTVDLDLPALLVHAAPAPATPAPGCAGARVICRIPPSRISRGEPLVVELPPLGDADNPCRIRVYPEEVRELAWLEIRHPRAKD